MGPGLGEGDEAHGSAAHSACSLDRACEFEDFARAPTGRYFVGESFLAWCANPSLVGLSLMGQSTDEDARKLVHLYRTVRGHPDLRPQLDVVTDAASMEGIEPSVLSSFLLAIGGDRCPQRMVRRHAFVCSLSLTGAIVAGLPALLSIRAEWKVHPDRASAFGWLDRPEAADVLGQVEMLHQEHIAVPSVVRDLRRYMQDHVLEMSLAQAALALGRSERALQRALQHAGTSFRDELNSVRIDVSKRLLIHTNEKVEAIALSVGCCSLAHFSTLFTSLVGQSPTSYRVEARRGANQLGPRRD
jgi:AraC-like DNA-binding protein